VNFFWTLARRREPSFYWHLVLHRDHSHWRMLYIVNHLSIPRAGHTSYPAFFGGVQDALVQWVRAQRRGVFLTTPILGIMYYFLPKAAERPVYSLPPVGDSIFGRSSSLHLGRARIHLFEYCAARLAPNARHDVFADALGPLVGRHAQRPAHLRGAWDRLRSVPSSSFFARVSRSTAWRHSRAASRDQTDFLTPC